MNSRGGEGEGGPKKFRGVPGEWGDIVSNLTNRIMGTVEATPPDINGEKHMSIYLTKYVHVEVPDYEVEIELDETEVLAEMDSSTVIEYVKDNYSASDILGELDTMDIIEHLIKRDSLPRLLRRIAEGLELSN